uniref:Hexosyltransferase n=1 Tax=Phallusia mammillata TaxID=59560 RepID=A0A6F9D9G4_9ASCI|nr:chondroitin sulfate N-acetylgalactosaminyltransferase 1 [Phallusia mammillata]
MKMTPKRILRWLGFGIALFVVVMIINQILPDMALSLLLRKSQGQESHLNILHNSKNNEQVMDSLQHQIKDLHQILQRKSDQLEKMQKEKMENPGAVSLPDYKSDIFLDGDSIAHYVQNQINNAAILKKNQWKNEYDINHFTMFDRHYIYKLDPGLKMRPVDLINSRKDWTTEFNEAVLEGIKKLNNSPERQRVSPTYRFTTHDFVHGLYRIETNVGTQYILVYRPVSNKNMLNSKQLFQVTIFRPFAPVQSLSAHSTVSDEKVHFIVPLQGRQDTFRIFLEYFKDFALASDGNVCLILVFYGQEGLPEIKHSLEVLQNQTGFKDYKIEQVSNEEFSRGRALQKGTTAIKNESALMFFCDVDIGFTADFLNQCRSHASEGKSVFYPIVFSLFNPSLVYQNEAIPALRDRQVHKRDNGLWRDFGFGMSCQYLSDFKTIGGFDLSIKGWGYEDTLLYRKYTQTNKVMVIRTPVNSLFHHWHPKHCDKSWAKEQYESCLRSKARTEGSQTTLGLLYFQLKEKLAGLS